MKDLFKALFTTVIFIISTYFLGYIGVTIGMKVWWMPPTIIILSIVWFVSLFFAIKFWVDYLG